MTERPELFFAEFSDALLLSVRGHFRRLAPYDGGHNHARHKHMTRIIVVILTKALHLQ